MQVLEKLVNKLELNRSLQKDIVVPAKRLHMTDTGIIQVEHAEFIDTFKPNQLFQSQMTSKLGIPSQYFQKMQEQRPELLAQNVNGWLDHNKNKSYLVRTFAGIADELGIGRAFLSDRYHIIDNYDVLIAGLEAIKQTGVNVEITKAEVTDNRMYLHVVCPDVEIQADAFLREYLKENDARGNGIVSGFVISNSEVGEGTFEIRPRAVIVKCNNGLVVKDDSYKRVHLGARMDSGEVKWSERTQQKNYELVISQTEDAIKTFLSPEYLGRMVSKIAEQSNIELEYPIDAVQNVCKHLGLTDKHKQSVLSYFLKDGSHTTGGIMHAVTREAQNMNPDLQHDVEKDIIEILPKMKRFDKLFSKN